MAESLIKVENTGKKFCKSLKHLMLYGMEDIALNMIGREVDSSRLRDDEFWALDDISFELGRGETLGVIGPNGSGKSTLLKLLNGIFMPDKGRITVRGRMGVLIEVGAGFHPMLTGRENIYVNGTILGMTKREIDRKFDSIVDFADIGEFIDAPVKHYSSGMYVRLGFSVAVHCEPDVLIIDEILAVGDKEFQIKCYRKMNEIRNSGVSIVLVSHNEYVIREQTTKALYLRNGKTRFFGPSEDAIRLYLKESLLSRPDDLLLKDRVAGKAPSEERKARMLPVRFLDENRNEVSFLESGRELNVEIDCVVREKLVNPIVSVNFFGSGNFMYGANSDYEKVSLGDMGPGKHKVVVTIPDLYLPMDNYVVSVVLSERNVDNLIDWHEMCYRITVGRAKDAYGSIKLPTKWTVLRD